MSPPPSRVNLERCRPQTVTQVFFGRAAREYVPADIEFAGLPQTWIGPMDWGVDFKDLSTMDYYQFGYTVYNYMIKQGYGALVAQMGSGIPVKLGVAATRINWGNRGVTVETSAGTIRAKACIVTVSSGVLNAGVIKFAPELPVWKQAAISHPFVQGAYSAAQPGHYQARIHLARSINKRLFFAGEATSPDYPALCSGAFITGETAAREVIAAIA